MERVFSHTGPAVLSCPGCGEDYLHQDQVQVFERMEDELPIVATINHPGVVTVVQEKVADNANPSDRRNGLTINFWCEHCDHRPVLAIWQHKGSTFMTWDKKPWQ